MFGFSHVPENGNKIQTFNSFSPICLYWLLDVLLTFKNQTHNILFFVEKISSSKMTTISFTQIMFSSWNIISLHQGVPHLQDPMPEDWGGVDGIIIEIKCTANGMCFSHPETIFSSPSPWKSCLPQNWYLVARRLGTAVLKDPNLSPHPIKLYSTHCL